jgi:branched-chain amino acid transport system substrate-binding protein
MFPAGKILVADELPPSDPQKRVLVEYTKAYQARFKEDVSGFGGYAYDAFALLARAVEQVGTDREKVRSAIENTKGFVGASGVFSFSPLDHNGLDLDAFVMLTVRNGRFAVHDK